MYAKEAEIVNEEFLLREDVYNLRRGGHGGFEYINKSDTKVISDRKARENTNKKLYDKYGENWRSIVGKLGADAAQTPESQEKRRATRVLNGTKSDASYMHTPEARLKVKDKFTENKHQQGTQNSQFGMMWITNEVVSKKIKKTDNIPEGFRRGRVVKNMAR